jgi:hypothetical protein
MANSRYRSHERQRPPEILIAVMGETGSGKSDFVQRVTRRLDVPVNHTIIPERRDVMPYDFELRPTDGGPSQTVRLIDCPGFDDTSMPDGEIINSILDYLKRTYNAEQKLHGIIYMLPITRPRVPGCTIANFSIFRELCGEDYYQNVILATTHWDQEDYVVAVERETELKTTRQFWGEMKEKGSEVMRLRRFAPHHGQATHTGQRRVHLPEVREEDLSILRAIAEKCDPRWLQAQVEMGQGREVSQTSAMRMHDEWQHLFQQSEWQDSFRQLQEVRQQYQRGIDTHRTRLQTERTRMAERMNQQLLVLETQFSQDRARIQRGEREIQDATRRRDGTRIQGGRPAEEREGVGSRQQERDRLAAAVRRVEKDELRDCKQHRDGLPIADIVHCHGRNGECRKVIDTRIDRYYRE